MATLRVVLYSFHRGLPPNECADTLVGWGRRRLALPRVIGQLLYAAPVVPQQQATLTVELLQTLCVLDGGPKHARNHG